MSENILVTYKSVTGFTKRYAEMIARETGCTIKDFNEVTTQTMSGYDTVVFGGRLHAGTVDSLKKAKKLFNQSKASRFIIYATGAAPGDATEIIEEMWSRNLSPEELTDIPHFYMQSGLCYEKMPFMDKMMMKAFCSIMNKKPVKDESDEQFKSMICRSYDISDRKFIIPLVQLLCQPN